MFLGSSKEDIFELFELYENQNMINNAIHMFYHIVLVRNAENISLQIMEKSAMKQKKLGRPYSKNVFGTNMDDDFSPIFDTLSCVNPVILTDNSGQLYLQQFSFKLGKRPR